LDDLAGEPARDCADDQPDDEGFNHDHSSKLQKAALIAAAALQKPSGASRGGWLRPNGRPSVALRSPRFCLSTFAPQSSRAVMQQGRWTARTTFVSLRPTGRLTN